MVKLFAVAIVVWILVIITSPKGEGKRFICVNCGHNFDKTFINMLCSELSTLWHPKQNYLRCPKCKVRDECSLR